LINYAKRNLFESSGWSPSARSEKSKVAEQDSARLSEVWFARATMFQ